MKNQNIKLVTGKIVTLEAFNMSKTYRGWIVGSPSIEDNKELINNICYPKDWGNRKSYVEKSNMYLSENVLKPIICSAWLSAKPINDNEKQFDGSEIVVIWFGNEKPNKSIKKIIADGLENFDWDKHAENIQF